MHDSFDWHDHFTVRRLKEQVGKLKERVKSASFENAADLRSVLASIDQLEADVGRALLKIHAVIDVLQAKGVFTGDELAAKAAELDALDGTVDGGLHPDLFRTEEERQRVPSPRAFLIALEKENIVSPKEFLRQLEERERAAEQRPS